MYTENNNIDKKSIIKHGDLFINKQCYTVTLFGKEINLYPKEFEVLEMLAKHPNWVFTKEQIYQTIYGEDAGDIDNIIYCLICGIRKKLKNNISDWNYIKTIPGVGYKFVVPEE